MRKLFDNARLLDFWVQVKSGMTIVSMAAETNQSWRHENVTVKGKSQDRYRDLSTGRFIKKP
jgi:hypothetical protein